jgi:hypothetical protein
MNPPGESLGQAIYTWSRSRLDRTKGMGFCAVSAGLEKDIDWLAKLNPPEFQLFHEDADDNPKLYEARLGFSEVGRTVQHDRAIFYRKTADGSFDDANRPQLVVHALIGGPALLGLSRIGEVRDEIWIREVSRSALGEPRLADFTLADVMNSVQPAPTKHVCPDDHKDALSLLRRVAAADLNGQGVIEFPVKDLRPVFLAFPTEVADGFSFDPYVVVGGVERNLALRAPSGPRPDSLTVRDQAADLGTGPDTCRLMLTASETAGQHLYGSEPDFRAYARTVLSKASRSADQPARVAPSRTAEDGGSTVTAPEYPEPVIDINPIWPLLKQVRSGGAALTEQENRALLNLLTPIHAAGLLSLDDVTLVEIFTSISDNNLIWKWHRYFEAESADTFTRLWNRTHVAAFLGIVLAKNLAAPDGSVRIDSDRGVAPEVTGEVLRSMQQHKFGSRALVIVIERGYGDSGATRQFITRVFEQDPFFLFDMVLKAAKVPVAHMTDYLRSGFEQWWTLRHLPEQEAEALRELLQPTFLDRVKVIFKR